jgi:hypothetical protein
VVRVSEGLLLVLLVLATFIVTYVVTESEFPPADWFRSKVEGLNSKSMLTLFTCPWCFSAYVAAALVVGVDNWFVPLALPLLWWLGTWGAAAAIAAVTGD